MIMALADGISTEITIMVCVNSLVGQVFVGMFLSFNPRMIIYDTRVLLFFNFILN